MRLNNHLFIHLIPRLCVLSQVSHSHSTYPVFIAHDSLTCHLLATHYVVTHVIHFIHDLFIHLIPRLCVLSQDCAIHTCLVSDHLRLNKP